MNTIYTLEKEIQEATEAFGLVKQRTISSNNFKDNLSVMIQRYTALINAFDKLSVKDKQKYADRIYAAKNDSPASTSGKACKIYADIVASVKSHTDSKVAFADIIKTAKAIKNVLNNFYANSKLVMDNKDQLNIHNAKLSHATALGMIQNAQHYLDYTLCLFNTTTYEIIQRNGIHELAPIAPYRYKFLEDFKNEFVDTFKQMAFGKHSTYLSNFKKLRSSKDDVYLVNNNGDSNMIMLDDLSKQNLNKSFIGNWTLNPFRWLGEVYNVYRHNMYTKMAAEKEDLEAHVALLQMELADKDPNSEEYAKAVKVIDSYNQMIAELDQKINEYYNEDI